MDAIMNSQYWKDLKVSAENIIDLHKLYGTSILVTGASGTIGSYIVDLLLYLNTVHSANIQIIAVGRNIEKLKNRFSYSPMTNLHFAEYNLYHPIDFNYPVDFIIHAAGNATPAAFNNDPSGTIVGNINGTFSLLEYGRNHNMKRFLFISSGEVYGIGNQKIQILKEDFCGPLPITSVRSCYPSSKRTTETLCICYAAQYGIETVIVRPCHTYGPGQLNEDNRAHAQFFRSAIEGKAIVLKSKGTQTRSYNYVADCVSGLLTVLVCGENGQAYNLANASSVVTIAEFATKIAKAVGSPMIYDLPNEIDIQNSSPIAQQILDTTKLEALGWHAAFDIDEGIRNTLNILKQANHKSGEKLK